MMKEEEKKNKINGEEKASSKTGIILIFIT